MLVSPYSAVQVGCMIKRLLVVAPVAVLYWVHINPAGHYNTENARNVLRCKRQQEEKWRYLLNFYSACVEVVSATSIHIGQKFIWAKYLHVTVIKKGESTQIPPFLV